MDALFPSVIKKRLWGNFSANCAITRTRFSFIIVSPMHGSEKNGFTRKQKLVYGRPVVHHQDRKVKVRR